MSAETAVLFVCLGNICRSPAAEAIFRAFAGREGLAGSVRADSAGTYGGHAGDLPDARMREAAARRGYELTHRSRRVRSSDFETFDLLVAMDDANYDDLRELAPDPESQRKVRRMVDFCRYRTATHVPDPYYSGPEGFEQVLDLLEDACGGLLEAACSRSGTKKENE